MEATKESVDNLIKNASSTIEDLFPKVYYDVKRLESSSTATSLLLRMALELRADIRFVIVELLTSLRACLNGSFTYEKCYHIKNLEGIRVEGYRMLCGAGDEKTYTILTRIGDELRRLEQITFDSTYKKAYKELVSMYGYVSNLLDTVKTTYSEKKSRNITYHYDDDLYKVYQQLIVVKNKGEDDPIKSIWPWLGALIGTQVFCDSIEQVENVQDISRPIKKSELGWNLSFKLQIYKKFANELKSNGSLDELFGEILGDVERFDWAAKHKSNFKSLESLLKQKFTDWNKPKKIQDIDDLLNVYLLVEMLFADLASVMRAYMNAGSDTEYVLMYRRIDISKVSALGHLVGYNEAEKRNALWPLIQSAVPAGNSSLKSEAELLRVKLEELINDEDVKKRALHVHLIDKDTHESNIPKLINEIESTNLIIEIKNITKLIQVLGQVKKFLMELMGECVKKG